MNIKNIPIKKKYIIIAGIVVVLGIVFWSRSRSTVVPEFTSAMVEKKNLVQSVEETGTVEANVKVEFGWEKSGRVVTVDKKVGDQVKKGDLIASLDAASERSNLAQSVAYLRSAQANLNLKFAPPSDETLRSSQASVDKARAGLLDAEANVQKVVLTNQNSIQQAERALETAKNNVRNTEGGENSQIINDAYEDLVNSLKSTLTKLSDALVQADNILGVDNIFANDSFEELLGKQQSSSIDIAKSSYLVAKTSINVAEQKVIPLTSTSNHSAVDDARVSLDAAVIKMQRNLADVKNVLNATLPGNNLTQTLLSGHKDTIVAAQTALNAAVAEITNAEQSVSTARNSLTTYTIALQKATQDLENTKKQADVQKSIAEANRLSAKASLDQAEAALSQLLVKPRDIDVASLRADVSRNQASVASAQNELNKTQIRALADGVIAKLDVEVGNTVSMNAPVVTLLSAGFAIKVDISESEIAKISLQDPATITLDAFGEDVKFTGTVASIEPAETKVSGVVYYKTTVVFDATDQLNQVKSGMTANVSILTDKKENVLVIPQRAILEHDGKKFVRVLTDKSKGKFEEKEIQTGLKGDNGEIEITQGLSGNEEIITFLKVK